MKSARKFAVLAFACVACAAPTLAHAWQGQWLTTTAAPMANTWFIYRKSFDLSIVPKSATAHIAVDSKYWLYVNGRLVVFEGGLKRGPAPSSTYIDSVDLAPFLIRGKNTVAVLHWFFGKNGFSHSNSGRPGFFFEADLGEVKLISDRTWRMKTTVRVFKRERRTAKSATAGI